MPDGNSSYFYWVILCYDKTWLKFGKNIIIATTLLELLVIVFLAFLQVLSVTIVYFTESWVIVKEGKETQILINFTLNKIKCAQVMNNRVCFVRNTCYFEVQ